MARHNIQATSTVCNAAMHTWLPGLTANYRECGLCHTVEVLRDGQWQSPTPRSKRSSRVQLAPSYSWTQVMRLKDRDFQGEKTSLVDSSIKTVEPSHAETVSSQVVTKRRELGERLFAWGTEHGYPQLHVHVPERIYTIADDAQSEIRVAEHIHSIATGVAAWRVVCFHCPQSVVDAALEQVEADKRGSKQ